MSKSKGGGTGRGTDSKGWTRWKSKGKGKPAVKDNSKILGPKGVGAAGGKGVKSGGLKWTESEKSGRGVKKESGMKTGTGAKTENSSGTGGEKGTKTEGDGIKAEHKEDH
jgi:hypothetical protein